MQAIVMHDAHAAKHCQQWLHLGDRRKGSAPFLFSFLGSSPPVTWKDIPCHLVYHGRQASCMSPKWATAEMDSRTGSWISFRFSGLMWVPASLMRSSLPCPSRMAGEREEKQRDE